MVAITATNSATPSLQASFASARRDKALHDAEQAETDAKSLRAQADQQDKVAAQARQKAHASDTSATAAPGNSAPSAQAPVTSTPKILGQRGASYVEDLSSVLQFGKSLLSDSYSNPAQKNIVTSSLFQIADNFWTASYPASPPAQFYGVQGSKNTTQSTGSLLNVSA